MEHKPIAVKICLGSACYTRGSREILESIQSYITEEKLESVITLTGSLCEEQCRNGPTITVDDVTYTGVDEKKALDLLDKHIHYGSGLQTVIGDENPGKERSNG
jgi:NADH:ubiquinone oxidoreductase subunit E